jgi:hypothetical protein
VNPIEIIHQLDVWRQELRDKHQALLQRTLRLATDACNALVQIDDIRSDAAVLLHERVKSLYKYAPTVLNGRVLPEHIETLMEALASARIYYWIRFLKGASGDELETLICHRQKHWQISKSFSIVYHAIRAVCPNERPPDFVELTDESLAILRRGCLADFANLEVVAARYGA